MIKTKDPKGKWSNPVLVKAGKGMIDATPLWDEDGKVYLIYAYAGSRSWGEQYSCDFRIECRRNGSRF